MQLLQLKCQSCDKIKQCKQAAVCNIYPVIYHRQRYDATDYLAWYIGRGLGMPMKNPDTFMASKCMLYKSPQWSYEKEWRLIVSKKKRSKTRVLFVYQISDRLQSIMVQI